ncbi:MAG: hypothetical protein ISS70_07040 [Phycisphaerae bacterium]|nr:hypothetical protein [Phycisphaerae bacterium]
MMDKEVLHKEIDLIQDCIKRMAHNSFLLKGWTVSLVAIVLALAKDFDLIYLCLLLLLPVICFWYLDAFFLYTEKMYRRMYEWVIANRSKTDEHLYNLNPHCFKKEVPGELKIMFSKTLFVFYGIPAFALIICFICAVIDAVC